MEVNGGGEMKYSSNSHKVAGRTYSALRVVLVVVATAISLMAQAERGSIRGIVSDATGAVIPETSVTAINEATGIITSSLSTGAGIYSIPQLSPGTYRIEAEKPGFSKLVRAEVYVEVAGVVSLDLTLEVGQMTETVTVTAATPQLKADTSDVVTSMNAKSYIELPLSLEGGGVAGGRNPGSFVFLLPGVVGANFATSTNGSQVFTEEIQIDGVSLQTGVHTMTHQELSISPDAVQEFSVTTGGYSAEYGSSQGGVQRYTIRSGTNEFHGNLYEYLRNEKLDARGFFAAQRSINKKNEFGGSFGGPIVRNRTFFFANFNWFRFRSGPTNFLGSVPPPDFIKGDLSALLLPENGAFQVYDPATTSADGQGGFTRLPFAGNIIPQSRFSSVSSKVNSFMPAPTQSGIVDNFFSSGTGQTNTHHYTMKFDHLFNDSHRISGMYNFGKNSPFPAGRFPFPMQNIKQNTNWIYHPRINYTWIISARTFNHFSWGYNRNDQTGEDLTNAMQWGQQLGLSGIPDGAFPTLRMDFYNFNRDPGDGANKFWHKTNVFSDTVSTVKGRHNLKFGGEYRWLHVTDQTTSSSGVYRFSRNETADPSRRATTGSSFASYLLGLVDKGDGLISEITAEPIYQYGALFVQDDFKLRSNLTLNLGLRWDVYIPIIEQNNFYSVMDPLKPNPGAGGIPGAMVFAGVDGAPRRLTEGTDKKAFAPRLGLAWSVTPKTVVRTGYGISYTATAPLSGTGNWSFAQGFQVFPSFQSQDQGLTPAFNWDDGFPQDFSPPPNTEATFGINGLVHQWAPNHHKPSYRQNWNFGIQYQIVPNMLLDVNYVGAKGTRLQSGLFNANQLHPRHLPLGDLLLKRITDPAVVAAGFSPPYQGFSGSLAQALRPFPQYTNVGTYGVPGFSLDMAPVGHSTYNALQVKLEKRYSKGLFLLSSFTWAKNLTDASSGWGGFWSPAARDRYNRGLEKALSVMDVAGRAIFAFNYELPFGPGKAFGGSVGGAMGKFLEGWQINGIMTYQSGFPLMSAAANTLPLFNSRNVPDVVPGAIQARSTNNFDPGRDDRLLLVDAFSDPEPLTFGDAPSVLNVRDFPKFKEDFGIVKRTYIGETVNIEFRFEWFNAFNRTTLGFGRFGGGSTNISNPATFGKVNRQENSPRQGQVVLRVNF